MRKLLIFFMAILLGACTTLEVPGNYSEPKSKDLNDLDADGVINARDICEGTTLGALVDHYGCGIDRVVEDGYELLVFFENDKSDILPAYQSYIARFADYMRTYPDIVVTVEGHTSASGSDEYNKALSVRRARNVAEELVEQQGIDPYRVYLAGYGEEQLWLTGMNVDQSAAGNRRVRVYVQAEYREITPKWTVFSVYKE